MIEFRTAGRWGMLLLLVITIVLGCNTANVYYVATNGSNSNPGTESQPWRTIQYAVDHVVAADTIMVRGGTYNESVLISVSGQEGNPITLARYGAEAVTINGGESPAVIGYTATGVEYWVVEGFTLESDAEHVLKLDSRHWIIRSNHIFGATRIYGSYNTFEHNEVDGSRHKGSENGVKEAHLESHHNVFRSNHIHHFRNRGIWSMEYTHDSLFEDNYVHHIQGYSDSQCIDMDGAGTVVWRHTVRGNHVHDCDQNGIQLENAFDCVVENNIVHDTFDEGITIINYGPDKCEVGGEEGQYGAEGDCRGLLTENIIRQNLIYTAGTVGGVTSYDSGGVKVWGNTIYGGKGSGVYFWQPEYSPGWEIRSNIITGNRRVPIEAIPPDAVEDHNLFSDPRFVDPSNYDFHLQANSPAIDAGIDIELTTDLDGNPRPQGAGHDIGAYEYTGGVQPTPTATPIWLKPLKTLHRVGVRCSSAGIMLLKEAA